MPDTPSFEDLPGLEPDDIPDSDPGLIDAESTQPIDPVPESGIQSGTPPSKFTDRLPDFNSDTLKPNEEELDSWFKEALNNSDPTDARYKSGGPEGNLIWLYEELDLSAPYETVTLIGFWEALTLSTKQQIFSRHLTEDLASYPVGPTRDQQKKLKAWIKGSWRAIALGGLGVIAGAFVLAILFQADPPDTQTLEPPTAATQEGGDSASEAVVGSEEPLSEAEVEEAAEIVAEFVECPEGTLWDDFGRYRSATPGVESPETPPETPVDEAFAVDCTGQTNESYVFTMIVRGDAETVFAQDGTTIDLRFIVNNSYPDNVFEDDTGFTVFVDYNKQFEQYVGWVTDAGHSPVADATVEIVWLEPTTLEATVNFPGDKVDIRNVRTELIGLIQDEQERTTGRYLDIAIWTAQP